MGCSVMLTVGPLLPRKRIGLVGLSRRGVGGCRGRGFGLRFRRLPGAAEHAIGAARQQVVLLERESDTALHLAHGLELLARQGPDLNGIDDLGSLDGVHTEGPAGRRQKRP